MSMTLEEAIIHAEEVVDRCEVTDGDRACAEAHRQLAEWLRELQETRKERDYWQEKAHSYEQTIFKLTDAISKQPEIIRCGECVYYDPPHVENEGVRYEYSEMPKEAFDVLGTGLVSVEYGINIGGRCCVDYYCKNYPDDKRVYVPKDNYCGRAERRTDE